MDGTRLPEPEAGVPEPEPEPEPPTPSSPGESGSGCAGGRGPTARAVPPLPTPTPVKRTLSRLVSVGPWLGLLAGRALTPRAWRGGRRTHVHPQRRESLGSLAPPGYR